MLKKLLLVTLFLLGASHIVWAQENEDCDSYPDVPVSITPVLDEPQTDFSTSISDLENFKRTAPTFYERLLLGVTTYKPSLDIKMYPHTITLSNGMTCAKLSKVDLTIGYQNIVMHIASEIPPNSCGANVVLAHEQKHVATNQQSFKAYVPILQQKLQDYFKINGLIRTPNYGYAMAVLHDNVKKIILQSLQEMDAQDQNQQKLIDDDAEFQQMRQSCNGQLADVARQYRITGK